MKNRIKECRKNAGMSQAELGNIVGLSRQAISLYEINKRMPSFVMWERLAKALHTNPAYLVGWSNIPQTLKQTMKPDRAKTHNS